MALHEFFVTKGFITASINFRQVYYKEEKEGMGDLDILSMGCAGGHTRLTLMLGAVDVPKEGQVGQGYPSVAIIRL